MIVYVMKEQRKKLTATYANYEWKWHSLTPGPVRGREGRAGEGGGPGWHQVLVFEQDNLIPLERVSTQEAAVHS